MPVENDQKPCTSPNCPGTMTYKANAHPPGWSAGFGTDNGNIVWGANEQPGWECDKNRDHFKAEQPA